MSEKFVFVAFSHLQPVKRAEDRSDVTGFRSFNNSTCKRVLNLLETGYFRLGKALVKYFC